MKYEVQISKVFRQYIIVEVEAEDAAEARRKALQQVRKADEEDDVGWCDGTPGRRRVEQVTPRGGSPNDNTG